MGAGASLESFLQAIAAGRDGVPVTIDEAQAITGLSRNGVLDRFRKLQAGGEGYLKLGRHGHPTRFYFRKGEPQRPEPATAPAIEAPAAAADAGLIDHRFDLRRNLAVTISLPHDLTEREAWRLARFVESLAL